MRIEADLKQIARDHEGRTAALEEEKKRIEAEIQEFKAKRLSLAGQIERGALARYERVRNAIPVLPIAEVAEGGFCSGCHAQITLQRQAEIKKNTRLMSCESCGRIVYYRNYLVT
jgi:predicted  nucleic acid-binding Zn-ribbon protein